MSHRATGIHRVLDSAAIYERLQRLLGGDAGRRRFVREFVRPAPGARILDVGCGTGALLEHLPSGVEYVGYDLNPRYIASAQRRYGDRGRFFTARVGEAPADPEGFDRVVATGLLHHLDDDDAQELMRSAAAHLRAGGALVTIDPVRHAGQPAIARFLIALDRGARVREAEEYRALAARHFNTVETFLLMDLTRVPYSHIILRATLSPQDLRGVAQLRAAPGGGLTESPPESR